MKKIKYLPDFIGSIGILAILIMLEILIASALYDAGVRYQYGDPSASVIHVFAFGIILSVLMHISGLTYAELFHPSSNTVTSTMLVLTVPIVLFIFGCFWWMTKVEFFISSLFPEDQSSLEMLQTMMNSGFATIIAICLVAPFLEEMLFRGIILRGLLGKYSPLNAILLSSALFGLIHMNIYQIPGAFIFGCFLGWLFYASRSLWPCIFAHAFYNAGAYVFSSSYPDLELNNVGINITSLLLSAVGLFSLYKLLNYRVATGQACVSNENKEP